MENENNFSTAVFTVCNTAYLSKALVLADSLMEFNAVKLKVVLFDSKQEFDYPDDAIDLIWVEDLGVPKMLELAFMYDIIEFSTSLKAFIALQLLEEHEKVVFLDPDTCLFSSVEPILDDLDAHPIVLTPHYTTPQPSTNKESDLAMMRFGSFNLGFFAINNSNEAKDFLEWWSRRSIDFCFMESQFGLSTDQKWVTIAPCLFSSIYISFDLGYNAAPWNTFERVLSKNPDGNIVVNKDFPLIFFHFSNFDHSDLQYLNKRASSEVGVLYPLLESMSREYSAKLSEKSALVASRPYSYDYMSDGSYITPTLRRAYAAVRDELPKNHDPFDFSGPLGDFIKKNYLHDKKKGRYSYPLLSEAKKNKKTFHSIYLILRVILSVVGPRRFYNLSKAFVYLSIYRKNRGLWKL